MVLNAKTTVVRGLPVDSGALVTPHSPVFDSLATPEDYLRFARRLRGQFCIIVREPSRVVAITDFGGSRPVFYGRDPGTSRYHVSAVLADLIPLSRKQISREALFFYAARGGVGIAPFYPDLSELHPATVAFFEADRLHFVPYLDWKDFLEIHPIAPADAERRFIAIASEYLSAIVKGSGRVGCLLSGGTDSALVAWLLQSIGADQVCLTADYTWKRYSEYSGAATTASALGLPLERVPIGAADRRRAFHAVNSSAQNGPCSDGLSPVMHCAASAALAQGIATLVTGDHADSLFLGFDRFFRAFPREAAAYSRATEALTPAAKLVHLYPPPNQTPDYGDLLAAFACNARECLDWERSIHASDCSRMAPWAEHAPLHTLQQLSGQMWAGVSWQNLFLPTTQSLAGRVEFVSPFYDIEMIRFAMSLPIEYKFRDGATKSLLRDVLTRILGRSIVKRASPNPARIWRLIPDLRERRLQGPTLRATYDRTFLRNIARKGNLWQELDKVGALGIWLSQQPLDPGSCI